MGAFFHTLGSEWLKLRTTRGFWWASFAFVLVSLMGAFLVSRFPAFDAPDAPPPAADTVVAMMWVMGFIAIAVLAIMVVTAEYRHNYQSVTFLMNPHRWMVALAKWLLTVLIVAALTFITVLIALYIVRFVSPSPMAKDFNPFDDEAALRVMWRYPVATALTATFAQGLAWILRQTAGAVGIFILFFAILEIALSFIPKWGNKISDWVPFGILNRFVGESFPPDFALNTWTALAYFAAWAFGLLVLGIVALERRDA